MTLTKESIVDRIEVVGPYSHVQVRTCERILEDGELLAEKYHRHVIAPGDDTSGEDPRVQAIVAVLHTPSLIASYLSSLESV